MLEAFRHGWTARLLALSAGLVAALAHPPAGISFGLLGFALLIPLIEAPGPQPLRAAFLRGWLAGVGYFAVSVWWLAEPFLVDAKTYGWMAPFAPTLMATGLALFWGAAAALYRWLGVKGAVRVLVFAGAFALAEWLRAWVLTGFPWNLVGESWKAGSAPSQMAALVGVHGLTWITIALGAAPLVIVGAYERRTRIVAAIGVAATLAGLYGFGAWRLAHAPADDITGPKVRIIQANIDQKEKWRPENLDAIFATYLKLTRLPTLPPADVVIWPEGALPAVIDDLLVPGSPYVAQLGQTLIPGQTLLLGVNRAEARGGGVVYHNSLLGLRAAREGMKVVAVYDKQRLVPFGEYIPAGKLAGALGLRSLVHMPEDFTPGPAAQPMAPPGLPPLQPLICYEALFPGMTSQAARRAGFRPAWILNVSNDAWFGKTTGPLQHLNLASYRAIEEGLPIVRSTPTGVSAVIDAMGRIDKGASLGLGRTGVIDARLPPALKPTIYSRIGDLGFALMVLLSAGIVVGQRYGARRAR